MPGHLPGGVVRRRGELLRRLSGLKKDAYCQRFIGSELQVLVQESAGEGMMKGLSRNYLSVIFPGNGTLINSELTVRINGAGQGSLTGEGTDPASASIGKEIP